MSRWARLGTLAVLVLVLPGCASLPWGQQARTDDPLKGDSVAADAAPPPKVELKGPKPDVQPPPGARKLSSFVREPAAAPSTPRTLAPSPAALVAATPKPIHNDQSLAIDNPKPKDAKPVAPAGWTAPRPTVEQLQASLRSKGITNFSLEKVEGRWFFRCFVPNPDNPNKVRCFEGEADDDVEAMQIVLDKLNGKK